MQNPNEIPKSNEITIDSQANGTPPDKNRSQKKYLYIAIGLLVAFLVSVILLFCYRKKL